MDDAPVQRGDHATRELDTSSADSGVIELELHDLNQLFNSMDPTPFPAKDLDQDAEEFIVGWAHDHPERVPLTLRVHLASHAKPNDPGALAREAIHEYFLHRTEIARRRLRQLLSRGRMSLLIGLLFLAACLGVADLIQSLGAAPPLVVLRESLIIGGWVAMWRPMEIFLYDWWPLRRERQVYERLSRATVEVIVRDARAKPAGQP
jgi:hypothetical protein